MMVLVLYVGLFFATWVLARLIRRPTQGLGARKTVTFGDESAVRADRLASVISVLTVFLIWGAFTGSKLVPLHVPGPFLGDASFTYTAQLPSGVAAEAPVTVLVHRPGETPAAPTAGVASGFAQADTAVVAAWRSALLKPAGNDGDGAQIIAINGRAIAPNETLPVADGTVMLTPKGSLSFTPDKGWQMEPIWLPPPEAVAARLVEVARDGYQNTPLLAHLWASVGRVLAGFGLGALVGIPLGYAMGLSAFVRGWLDPIVEFMRPVPPLALIPLIIIWFGIWESGKIVLLFLAALWIMVIAARSGVSGVRLSKIHAAYSLGASKAQVLWHVIIPNSLPDLFTGARVAMGVCWGTVVAAELVAAEKGAGMMILVASKFQLTDIVVMGIILIGSIGYGIDILMRQAERKLVPWKGRG
jgi:taurine transport system permease protein